MKKSLVLLMFSALIAVSPLSFSATLIAANNSSHSTFLDDQDSALAKAMHKPTNELHPDKALTQSKMRLRTV